MSMENATRRRIQDRGGKADGVLSLQGTSMATPVVAGTAAILRQYFEQGYYPTGVKDETVSMCVCGEVCVRAAM